MDAEFQVHRTMICDRLAPRPSAVRSTPRCAPATPLSTSGPEAHLSVCAARAGAARVDAVERTPAAVLAQELAAGRGRGIVRVIHCDVTDVEPPERVDVIVSEWLGGSGIDEGMLVPAIVARDRWLKPGGAMIPAWSWPGPRWRRPRSPGDGGVPEVQPVRRRFDDLVEKTVNEIFYSGTFRDLAAHDKRSEGEPAVDDRRGRYPASAGAGRHQAETVRPVCATERPTRSHCGSAPSSRPASHCRWHPPIRRRTGGR